MNINSKLLLCVSLFLLFLNPEETFAKNDTKIFRGGLERTGVYQVKVIEEGKKYLPPSADIIRSAPIYHNNNIYYGSNDHFLYSVNLTPGEFNWKFETGGAILASPALLNGTLYFGSSDRALYAIDEKTGKERWYFETNGAITTSPLVTAGTVFFGSGDGFVYAISTKTGSLIWKFPTNSPVNSSPSIFEDILYVGNNDGQLYAVDIKNGKGVWSFKTNGTIEATPVVTEEMVFVGSHDHYFYAIDRKTGQKRWGYKSFGSIFSAAAIFQDTIFFGSEDTRIYAMDISNGNVKWQLPAKDSITYAPIVVNGLLYAYSTDWYVYIIEPSNGKLLKTIYNGGPSSIPPTIGGSYLFTSDGPAYRMIVRNITKINGAEDCETKTSVFTDGKGNNRTKKLGGNYAAIKLDSLNAEDLLRINPVSGTFKYVTLHARYSGGYWKTIYKGANTSFPVAKYLSSYKKDKKCTHVNISVNGAHEKYEPIACNANILVCSGAKNTIKPDCSIRASVFNDGKGDNRTKKRGGNYTAIKLDSLNAEDLLRINPVSGTFKYVTLHARYSGGYWKTIYKGANTSFPVAKYLSSYKKDKKCTHVIISVNGAHEKYEPVACKADILVCEKPLRSPE